MDINIIQLMSDFLSLITIGSCLILKIPQIMKIRSLKSAVGVNVKGLMLELFSYSTTFLYNFCNSYSLLSYMEYPIILIQEIVLVFFVLKYNGVLENFSTTMYTFFYFGIVILFMMDIIPASILTYVVPFCTPISASSKVLFLYDIVRTKNSEAVSLITWSLSAFTNATRIFTIYVDSADKNLLANFIVSTFLSSSVLGAAWFYKKKQSVD